MSPSVGAHRAGRRAGSAAVLTFTLSLFAGAAWAEPLSLEAILARAAAEDPSRAVVEARVDAAEAAARQAGFKPNPTVGLELENFGGTGNGLFVDRAETTVYYQQQLERSAKREARTGAARAGIALAEREGRVRTLDLLAKVQGLWVEAAAAQAEGGLAQERLTVAKRLADETDRRVRAARDPLFAAERARTAVIQARIALDQAQADVRLATAALAAYLPTTDLDLDLSAFERLDPGAALTAGPVGGADLAVLEAERDAAMARLRIEETKARQDPTVRAGLRHFRQGGDFALVVEGSIPLGRNDANQGNIERARAERQAAEAEIAVARTERNREIARLVARRASTAGEIGRIDAEVMPGARRAVDLVLDGYRRGGGAFTFLEVAEAQRAVIDAGARRVSLIKTFHLDGVRLDRMTDRHAALIASPAFPARAETR